MCWYGACMACVCDVCVLSEADGSVVCAGMACNASVTNTSEIYSVTCSERTILG